MGLPSTSIEGFFRNSLEDVQKFLNTRHPTHYKVYNLCEEKPYPDNLFFKQGYFPFKDHEVPPLNIIRPFCEDATKFLNSDPKNVIDIHCLAGKGRTGTLISCLLLYMKQFLTATACLKYYGLMRVEYVYYFESFIKNNIAYNGSFLPEVIIAFKELKNTNLIQFTVTRNIDIKKPSV